MTKQPALSSKVRAVTFIVYPESAPDNWEQVLSEPHLKWTHSPIHDKDVNPDGEIKKAHYHCLIAFDGPTTLKHANEIVDSFGFPIPPIKPVASVRGLVRYFTHRDNPEKYQYDTAEIKSFCGFEHDSILASTETEKTSVLREMCKYITDNRITSFSQFAEYCNYDAPSDEWFEILTMRNTLFIRSVITSVWQDEEKAKKALQQEQRETNKNKQKARNK